MKTVLLTAILVLTAVLSQAQLYVGSDANSLVVKSGETFHYDGLTLTPSSSDLTLSNTTLTKIEAYTISPTPTNYYIKRYFNFSNTTPAFTGTLTFSYDGAVLEGSNGIAIAEADLRLNIQNGTVWSAVSDLPDQTNNLISSAFTNTTLNTLALAKVNFALPVIWLSFTVEKKDNSALLHWSTAAEKNAQDFVVQHSTNGIGWTTLGSVKAVGNTNSKSDYTFTHYAPLPGYNYYRLIQRDLDGQFSYSKVVSLPMDKADIKLKAFPNPVMNGNLNVVLKEAAQVILYDASGRQVITQRLNAGLQLLNVTGVPGGVYQLRVGAETISVIIQ